MRYSHSRGTTLRMVAPMHIVLTSGTRFRFNSVGVMEVLEFETRKTQQELLTEDLVRLGLCLLSVASRVRVAQLNSSSHREATGLVKAHCSPDFVDLLNSLLQAGSVSAGRVKTCDAICASINDHLMDEMDLQMAVNDGLHSHLQSEYVLCVLYVLYTSYPTHPVFMLVTSNSSYTNLHQPPQP